MKNTLSLKIPKGLLWLRLLSMILVFLGHSQIGFGKGQGSIFFLVISGYIFTRFFIKEWMETGAINVQSFLGRRFVKIIPALIAAVLFNIVVKSIIHKPISFPYVFSVLTFTSNYYNAFNNHPSNGLAHLWTLSMVIQFYILWPFLFTLLAKKNKSSLAISTVLSLIIIAIIIYRYLLIHFNLLSDAYIYNSLETRLDCFLIGSIVAFNMDHPFIKKFANFSQNNKWSLILLLIIISLINSMPRSLYNIIGFDIHAILIGFLIIQIYALENIFEATFFFPTEILTDAIYWFYLLHPWGDALGKIIHQEPYEEVIMGGGTLLLCMLLLGYLKYVLMKERKKMSFRQCLLNIKNDFRIKRRREKITSQKI